MPAARRLGGLFALAAAILLAAPAAAAVGDPQVGTDHPWYAGELSCSTFERLRAAQAALYRRVVGKEPATDEQKALASWLWRNTHYWHGEEGAEDLWGRGFTQGGDLRTREYWTGLFADGFGLCGTTHSQWIAEMEELLGHGRGRGVGVEGHNSFEVFLRGGPYGDGRWALLDHDVSTVIFSPDGDRLLSIPEVKADLARLIDRSYKPEKQHGWLVLGLHPGDGGVYRRYDVAEYLAGYSGPPPVVHLRRGESFRRYLAPGLDDGKTFVFWGRNYKTSGIPGPERSITWVNQPDKMYRSRTGAGYNPGQARYANAVYTYAPDFSTDSYREGVTDEGPDHVTFEFYTPYIIAATPPNEKEWGIYDAGCRNGLVLRGSADCAVSLSLNQGRTRVECGRFSNGMDLTDHVKGYRQYLIRFGAPAARLAGTGLTMRTVCQANSSIIPHLKDEGTGVEYQASGRGIVSAGPTLEQARTHVAAGGFGTPAVTLRLDTPRKERAVALYAAAHILSGNPPAPDVKYQIEYSTDSGATWKPVVRDWQVTRRQEEPGDFWSQSLCWGSVQLDPVGKDPATSVQVRFSNNGGKAYARTEAHLLYQPARTDPAKVTFDWMDDKGPHRVAHVFPATAPGGKTEAWQLLTGRDVRTRWVQIEPALGGD